MYFKIKNRKICYSKIKKLCSYLGIPPFIFLIGGDPIIHNNFKEIVELTRKFGFLFSLKCNPNRLLDKSMLKFLLQNKVKSIQFTIEGSEKYHDSIRGKNAFKKLCKTTLMLNRLNIPVIYRFNIRKENKDEFERLMPYIDAVKPNKIGIKRVCYIGNFENNKNNAFSPQEYREFLSSIFNKYVNSSVNGLNLSFKDHLWFPFLVEQGILNLDEFYFRTTNQLFEGCTYFGPQFVIDVNGDILPCRKIRHYTLGNIFTDDLIEVYNSKKRQNLLNIENYEKCYGCKYVLYCRGCPAVSESIHGNIFKEDPQCWVEV
jgi:radical SAM protein with 4Fe4S-binding SPASM domain